MQMTMNWNGSRWLRIGAVAVALMVGTGIAAAESVLRIGSGSDLQIVDPGFTTAHASRDHGYLVYDTLFGVDSKMQPQPQMLESWTVAEDGMSIRFELRDGLTFHDGTPVTSGDVISSIDRWRQGDSMARLAWTTVEGMEADGDDAFVMHLKEPSTIIIEAMAKPSGQVLFIMPERLANTPITEQIQESIGSGPFTFDPDEWVVGQRRIYRAFEDYVPRDEPSSNLAGSKAPGVDVLEFMILPDAATQTSALLAGEVDYIADVPADLLPLVEGVEGLVTRPRDLLGEQLWMRFNHLTPPFNDVRVRRAVLHAVSQEEYMATVIGNDSLYQVCLSMWGCGTAYSTDAGTDPLASENLQRARELLDEAGYAGEKVVVLDAVDYPPLHNASLKTAEMLREIGMNVELQGIPVATLGQVRVNQDPVDEGGWSIFHTTFPTVDVLDPLRNPAVDSSCKQNNWPGWPCNEEIEDLRAQFLSAGSADERHRLAEEIQKLAYEHVTHIPLGTFFKVNSWSDKLEGVENTSVPVFWGISKSE